MTLKKLKVLVISHSSVQGAYRRKFELLSEKEDLELRLIVPKSWWENYRNVSLEHPNRHPKLQIQAYDVVFSGYGSRFFFRGGIWREFKDFKPELIHLEEEAWSLCALQTILWRALFCPKSQLIFRTSLSVEIKLRFPRLARFIEKLTFKRASYAFVLSERARELLAKKGYKGGIRVFPNGVDMETFKKLNVGELKSNLGLEGKFVIGYVGRLLQMKGLETLFHAASQLKLDYKLLLVGSGEYKDRLISLAKELQISERLIFTDSVPIEAVPKYMNCMDVLVLPSVTTPGWVEFFGRVLVEAMSCEVPVIGSSSGEIPNVVADAGLIFYEGDANGLAEKIEILYNNPKFRAELIAKGYKRTHERFSWQAIVNETYRAYKEVSPHRNLT